MKGLALEMSWDARMTTVVVPSPNLSVSALGDIDEGLAGGEDDVEETEDDGAVVEDHGLPDLLGDEFVHAARAESGSDAVLSSSPHPALARPPPEIHYKGKNTRRSSKKLERLSRLG